MVRKISEERYAEHEPHGWRVLMPLQAVLSMEPVPGYWMTCTCGWTGWVEKDPNRKPVERYDRHDDDDL